MGGKKKVKKPPSREIGGKKKKRNKTIQGEKTIKKTFPICGKGGGEKSFRAIKDKNR